MFFKKKDKDEAPAKAAAPEPRREEPRREEPRRQEPPRQSAPPAAAPTASAPPPVVAPPMVAGAPGSGAAIEAALVRARGDKGAPASYEARLAQTAAADRLASSADPADRAAARDIAAGELEKGFDTLFKAANTDAPEAAARWRTLGALAFTVDARRSRFAYLSALGLPTRVFKDGIWVARLRGFAGELQEALEAAYAAGAAATNDYERAVAHCEAGLILQAAKDPDKAFKHAEQAVLLAGPVTSPELQHHALVSHALLGDTALALNDVPKARKELAEALDWGRKLGATAPKDPMLALGVCELLERNAVAALTAEDGAAAVAAVDEAITLRQRLAAALPDMDRGLARALTLKGEALRAAGNRPGALAAFAEGLGLVRKVSDAQPRDPTVQRDLWRTMWRLASLQDAGVEWGQVVSTMEKMQANGALDPDGDRFLEEGRRRLAAA